MKKSLQEERYESNLLQPEIAPISLKWVLTTSSRIS